MDREWELKALCRSQDPEIWFSEREAREARRLCGECPVSAPCLEAILASEARIPAGHRHGIVAGLSGRQRARLAPAGTVSSRSASSLKGQRRPSR